ncbi:NAD(P)H-binding protein [Salinibacterium sp.]|uniref:NAD(P)-dependent oxidoreductase n=1 Tax=Salinibacterium sp. TaxID=1915057 RepID=UPI00286A4EDF|nr:NAD(P)H-binding protein [Salinibacterium sp.]
MRVCILGANGNCGRRLVAEALERGHAVTAVVRAGTNSTAPQHDGLVVRSVSFDSSDALIDVMKGQDVVINAAGYLAGGAEFTALVARVVVAAQVALGAGGRFWCFGGIAMLDVPGRPLATMDLPLLPTVFEPHRTNLAALTASDLDWSMLCPGPMIDSPDGSSTEGLQLSVDSWPATRAKGTRALPKIALTVALKRAMPSFTIYYEDAARVILDNLDRGGQFACSRVGVALPAGHKRHKPSATMDAESLTRSAGVRS